MKSECNNMIKKKELPYPKLMQHSKTIVLFADDCVGTVVYDGTSSPYSLGYHNEEWDMASFTDCSLIFEVILSNE